MTRSLAAVAAIGLMMTGANAAEMPAPYQHVLLISIDGLHAFDIVAYAKSHPASQFATLMGTGVFYPNAVAPVPSDSFPGLAAMVTGGTPYSTGVFYDDSYDRTYFAPGSNCEGSPGSEAAFAENIDVDSTKLDGGGTPGQPRTQIDEGKLPLALVGGKCVPVWPHDLLRVNTAFEVIREHGWRTAWSDKHPAYEWLNGPSGSGVDDLFALEQDSLIPGTKVKTTGSFKAQRDFDQARVKALINEIHGLDSTGQRKATTPTLFGMNFQAVSVGQKLPKGGPGDEPGMTGGYADAEGTPNNGLSAQLDYIDTALGDIRTALRDYHLETGTLIVIASKHGQSPIDRSTFQPKDDEPYTKLPGYAFHIADDAALIWLKPQERAAALTPALASLQKSIAELGIGAVLTPGRLAVTYHDPAVDSRTPDFMVITNPGVVYTSGSKIAEHGGQSADDRGVALLISNPALAGRTVPALVQTTQVAPTILKALGYDPGELRAVAIEGTPLLPALPF